jgi:hypothetical protein
MTEELSFVIRRAIAICWYNSPMFFQTKYLRSFFCFFIVFLLLETTAHASLIMAASPEDAVKKAKVILLVKAKNKNVKPKYKKIGKVKRLDTSQMDVFGKVVSVLLGKYNPKTFNGTFSWKNTMNYDAEGNETEGKVVASLESGEEGSLEQDQEWIIYLDSAGTKPVKGKHSFFRAENAGAKDYLLSILCKRKSLKSQMPEKGKELCANVKREE